MRVTLGALVFLAALTGCEGVPDLRFADALDASSPSPASTGDDGGASTNGSGGTVGAADADTDSGALPSSSDGGTVDASDAGGPPKTSCPGHAPSGGTTCCGPIVCVGDPHSCNCPACGQCASEGYCCPVGLGVVCKTNPDQCPG